MKYPNQAPTANIPIFLILTKKYPINNPNITDTNKHIQVVDIGDSSLMINSRENNYI